MPRSLLLLSLLFVTLSCGILAGDYARIDVEGLEGRNKLEPRQGVIKQTWRDKFQDYCLTARFFPNSPEWKEAQFSFTPEKNGTVKLLLVGCWLPKEELERREGKWFRVYYKKIEAEGATIVNGDFSQKDANGNPVGWAMEKGAEYIQPGTNGIDGYAVLVRCYAPASQVISVKGGVPVTVKLVYKPEQFGKPLESSWLLPDGGNRFEQIASTGWKNAGTHPRLLFSKDDIDAIREKSRTPYFRQYTADLIKTAQYYLTKYPPNTSFPFKENPNFQEGVETLLMAQILTGDKVYGKRVLNLVKTFVDDHFLKVPVVNGGKFDSFLADGNSVSFILRPIALAYDILFNEMSETERKDILKGLAYFSAITSRMASMPEYSYSLHKNYTAGQMGGLGLAALAMDGEFSPHDKEWLAQATKMSERWNREALYKDGMYPEGVHYYFYMCDNQLLLLKALQKNRNTDLFHSTNLPKTLDWLIWSVLPWGGEIDNFGDAYYFAFGCRNLPQTFQSFVPGKGDYFVKRLQGNYFRYNSNPWAIVFGKKPYSGEFEKNGLPEKSICLPYCAMAAFNTGWGAEDILLTSYATKYRYAAHSQADRGQFNLYGYGHKWATDSGYGNDAKEANSGSSPMAHNQVLIDGVGQAYDPAMNSAGISSRLVGFAENSQAGYVCFDLKSAYDSYQWYSPSDVRKWNPVEFADRHIFFVRNEDRSAFVLVFDDIKKDSAQHDYIWQMQTSPANRIRIVQNNADISPLQAKPEPVSVGSESWEKSVNDGLQIFGANRTELSFTVNAENAGEYYLWLKTSGRKFMDTCAEISVNGKPCGRITPSYDTRPHWSRFTLNKKKMMSPEALALVQGENKITLRHFLDGYWFYEGILTPDRGFIPGGHGSSTPAGSITISKSNVSSVMPENRSPAPRFTDATCSVSVLSPRNAKVSADFFQPGRQAIQPRLRFSVTAVNPEFLIMLFPKTKNINQPLIDSETETAEYKLIRLTWTDANDVVLINRTSRKIDAEDISTDAKIVFIRYDKDNRVRSCLSSKATHLSVNGKLIGSKETPAEFSEYFSALN